MYNANIGPYYTFVIMCKDIVRENNDNIKFVRHEQRKAYSGVLHDDSISLMTRIKAIL